MRNSELSELRWHFKRIKKQFKNRSQASFEKEGDHCLRWWRIDIKIRVSVWRKNNEIIIPDL